MLTHCCQKIITMYYAINLVLQNHVLQPSEVAPLPQSKYKLINLKIIIFWKIKYSPRHSFKEKSFVYRGDAMLQPALMWQKLQDWFPDAVVQKAETCRVTTSENLCDKMTIECSKVTFANQLTLRLFF